jgi:hypothetical protein
MALRSLILLVFWLKATAGGTRGESKNLNPFKGHRERDRRAADLLGAAPRRKREFDAGSKVHSSTIIRRFGSWQAGLEVAERGQLYGGGAMTKKMRVQNGRNLRDEDLLPELRRVAQVLGRSDLTIDDINYDSVVGQVFSRKRFGTSIT